jgi:signal transduction histidine kinase
LKPILSERVPSSLNHIRNSGEKMDMLINGLLRISRVGRLVVHSERVDMNAMLKSVASTMAFQAQKLRAEISIGDLPPCMGDHAQLSQVFSNLMDNALKYCEPSRSPRIEVSASVDGRMVTYKIADNGKGMKEEDLSRAFEIFKRLEGSEGVPGEGLGLAIVKRIVEKHGGKIWVESEPGVGSTFFVELQTA